jgi:hypothetical protein
LTASWLTNHVQFGAQERAASRNRASWSINFCACAALIVCVVIVSLFVEQFFQTNLKWFVGGLFVCAMIALICGLSAFLREVYLGTHTMRIDVARFGG